MLLEVSETPKESDVEIKSTDTIKEAEKKFERQYGLPVRILRKQNGVLIGTSITDDLTLHEQNTWGREASKPLKFRSDDHIDWNRFSLGK